MNIFKEKLKGKRIVRFGIDANNMYWAEIRDKNGDIESATTVKTMADVFRWIREREYE